jgi:hypothetical protein
MQMPPIVPPLQVGEGSSGNQSAPTPRRGDLHRRTGRVRREERTSGRRNRGIRRRATHIGGEIRVELRKVFACVPRRVGSALARHDVSTRTWPKTPARSLLSNPDVKTCVCQHNRKAVCSSTSGKLPTTRSSLRRQLHSQLPSQLRSQLRSLGSQRQRSLGSQRQRRLGSLRSLGSHRSLCSRRSHGLPVPSPEAFPCSPCRRRRTSPG